MQTSHQLIDHEGNPVPAALVMTSYQAFSDIIDLSSDQSPSVLTDDEGYFRFPTTFDVDYKTIAAFPVAGPACVIRNQYGERKYRLADPMSIRGHVTDAVGRAIPRMVMRVQNDRLPSVVRVVTAKDGSFQVDGLPCSETSHLSGTRHLAPRYFLRRHRFAPAIREVIDLGNLHAVPSRDLTVRVVPSSNAALPLRLTVTAGSKNATIDEQGEVQFQAVAPITSIRLNGSVSVARTDPPLQRVWGENAFAIDTDSVDSIVLYLD